MAGLIPEDRGFRREGMVVAFGGELLIAVELGVQSFALAAPPGLPGEDPAPPALGAGPERGDRPVQAQAARPRAHQRVETPVDSQGDHMPGAVGLRYLLG